MNNFSKPFFILITTAFVSAVTILFADAFVNPSQPPPNGSGAFIYTTNGRVGKQLNNPQVSLDVLSPLRVTGGAGDIQFYDWDTVGGDITTNLFRIRSGPDVGFLRIQRNTESGTGPLFGTFNDLLIINNIGNIEVPGKLNATELCIAGTCQASWPGGGALGGSGTAGQVTFWSGPSDITGDAAFNWDDTNKRLGVGILSPQDKVHIKTAAGFNGGVVIDTTDADSATSDASLSLFEAGVLKWQLRNDGSASDQFLLKNAGSNDILSSTQNGNVGIGTASVDPSYRITTSGGGIKASGSASSPNATAYFTNTGTGYGLLVDQGNVGIGTVNPSSALNIVSSQNSPLILNKLGSTGISFSSYWPTLALNMYHDGSQWVAIGAGYVGIWNQNPATGLMTLGVSSGSRTAGQGLGSTPTSDTLAITSSGNVGIGNTAPAYKLDISNGALRLAPTAAPTGANGVIYYDSTANKFKCYENAAWKDCIASVSGSVSGSGTAGKLPKWDTGTSLVDSVITESGGNIGINSGIDGAYRITTSGGGIKAVSGATPAGYFDSATGYGLLVDQGNVGIGILAPAQKLEVGGKIRLTGGQAIVNAGGSRSVLLDIDQAAAGVGRVAISGGGPNDELRLQGYGSAVSGFISFYPAASEIMRIQQDGAIRLAPQASVPTGSAGAMYYDSTTGFRCHNGTSWGPCDTTGAGGITNVTGLDPIVVTPSGSDRIVSLAGGCSPGQILKRNAAGDAWECSADSIAGGGGSLPDPGATNGYTLRWDGFSWIANTNIFNGGGNIGIGTAVPNHKLTVGGNFGIIQQSGNANSNLFMRPSGAAVYNEINFMNAASDVVNAEIIGYAPGGTINGGNIYYNANEHVFRSTLGTNDALYINSAGNIGVDSGIDPSYRITTAGGGIKASGSASSPNATAYFTNTGTGYGLLVDQGNVGIGTTNPGSKLDVYGTIDTNVPVNVSAFRIFDGSTFKFNITEKAAPSRVRLTSGAGIALALTANNSDTLGLLVDTAGNVGIGTTNPTQQLALGGNLGTFGMSTTDGSDTANLQISGGGQAGTTRGSYINLYGNEHATAGKMQFFTGTGAGGGNDYEFYTDQGGGSTAKLVIRAGGNVGIGTVNPGAKLEVAGTIRTNIAGCTQALETNASGDIVCGTDVTGGGGAVPGGAVGAIQFNDPLGTFAGDAANFSWDKTNKKLSISSDFQDSLLVLSRGIPTTFKVGIDGAMVIDNDGVSNVLVLSGGNVGIKTAAPDWPLHVNGRSRFDDIIYLVGGTMFLGSQTRTGIADSNNNTLKFLVGDGAGSQERMRIDGLTGNVGIGTTNPTLRKLHIYESGQNAGIHLQHAGASAADWLISTDANNPTGGGLIFYDVTAAQYRMVIDSSGNVGIGNQNPAEKLDISGAIKIGNTADINAGTIRWTGADFEGYTGTVWKSMTGSGAGAVSGSGTAGKLPKWDTGTSLVDSVITESGGSIGINSGIDGAYRITTSGGGIKASGSASSPNATAYFTNTGTGYGLLVDQGNVGIGTTNPGNSSVTGLGFSYSSILHVHGSSRPSPTFSGTGIDFRFVDTDAAANTKAGDIVYDDQVFKFRGLTDVGGAKNDPTLLINTNTGDVGIGTANPGAKLEVAGTIRTNIAGCSEALETNASGDIICGTDVTGGGGAVPGGAVGAIQFNSNPAGTFTGDTANLFWDDTNNRLGIGTAGPARALHVLGSASIGTDEPGVGALFVRTTGTSNQNGFVLGNTGFTASARWWIDASNVQRIDNGFTAQGNIALNGAGTGNVGIGNTSPSYKLDVTGEIRSTVGFRFPDGKIQTTSASGGIASVQVFTTSGTWTRPSGTTKIHVEIFGGGGGGGAGYLGCGNGQGGAGGGYAESSLIDVSAVSLVPVSIGGGGTAGVVGGAYHGGDGETSSFGSYVSATGGKGGRGKDIPNGWCPGPIPQGLGGIGQNGLFNSRALYVPTDIQRGSDGAVKGGEAGTGRPNQTGSNGTVPGGGGGGGTDDGSNHWGGGSGAPGMVVIWEYK